jgi:hypothetical protein
MGSKNSDTASNIQNNSRKKTQSVEPPKINTAGVDLIKPSIGELEDKLREHTNFQKKN